VGSATNQWINVSAIKKGSLVHVTWLDAETTNEWTDEKDLHDHKSLNCETVGYLVKKATPKSPIFIIASTRSKDDKGNYEYNAITKIPQAMTQEIEQLEKEENDE
jgi:hypothetical protein